MRIYTPEECERLDASCRGFLLFLEQIQVLNLETVSYTHLLNQSVNIIDNQLLWCDQMINRNSI